MPGLMVTPDVLTIAARDIAGIGSAITDANATAATSTLGILPPAADSVSAQLAELFGGHAQTYQSVSTRGEWFHRDFANALRASAAGYDDAEAKSANGLGKGRAAGDLSLPGSRQHHTPGTATRLWQAPTATSQLWRPGMPDPRLATARPALTASWSRLWQPDGSARLSRGIMAPRLIRPLEIATSASSGGRAPRFPILHQIVQNQIGYLHEIIEALDKAWQDELVALKALPQQLHQALVYLEHGDIEAAMKQVNKSITNLFFSGLYGRYNINGILIDQMTGVLPDLAPILTIPAQEMQNLADLLKPLGFGYAGKAAQHVADNLNAYSKRLGWVVDMTTAHADASGKLQGGIFMSRPLQIALDVLGPEILTWQALQRQTELLFNAIVRGNPLQALIDVIATPAQLTKAFLFGSGSVGLHTVGLDRSEIQAHIGGLFAPLSYQTGYFSDGSAGTMTGGLIAALVSLLPPILQWPFHDLRSFVDGFVALATGHPAVDR